MTTFYRIDPTQGKFTVHADSTGLLSVFAHSPTFAVRAFEGVLRFENEEVAGMNLAVNVRADSLDLLDQVGPSDRREILDRMTRDVLETARFPEIQYQAADVAASQTARSEFRLDLNGPLTLHGITQPHNIQAMLRIFEDALVLRGQFPLRLSDYQIQPVTALGGSIQLKDELQVAFELFAFPGGPA